MRSFVAITALGMAACVSATQKDYVVKDLRIVSIVAEPPEVTPGNAVGITVYFATPTGGAPTAQLGRCPERGDTAGTSDCASGDEIILASGTATPVASESAVAETTAVYSFSFIYTVPADLLDNPNPLVATYGFEEVILAHAQGGGQTTDGLKRIVVSKNVVDPNQNPMLKDLDTASGGKQTGSTQAPPTLTPNQAFQGIPVYDASTLQPFQITAYDGTIMNEQEQGIFTWSCAPDCTLDTEITFGFTSVKVTPTVLPLTLFVVMRDGRGGEAFKSLAFGGR